jgi:hypothetical protein
MFVLLFLSRLAVKFEIQKVKRHIFENGGVMCMNLEKPKRTYNFKWME